ncbi:M23 family metallopeptidase [Chengkuizengella axinellae]|uniref:M23 family metallopeptidase n=1 Tax=Chengkuizengella axinellae TaxID=3064388 RepID=A0ABT9IZ53_9BACL|nr:M23 family metallopeptidase [Chengkuizengella sp. 2205SS18-9]MDP5274644.1 M23 family metallopeptidase [Chengkuizengella sp. 2205SS18-9]
MKENNKEKQLEQTPENKEGASHTQAGSWKRFFSKKWVFPAMYMAAVVLIVSFMVYFQSNDQTSLTEPEIGLELTEDMNQPTDSETGLDVPVVVTAETIVWPVENKEDLEIIRHFYDENGDNESKLDAVVEFQGSVTPSVGVSIAHPDGESFDVLAANNGKVTRVEKHPVTGNLVEIVHEDGMKTVYQSLTDVQVEVDQEVEQGDVIAKAGTNELDKDFGVHLDFEIYENDVAVNPEEFIQS